MMSEKGHGNVKKEFIRIIVNDIECMYNTLYYNFLTALMDIFTKKKLEQIREAKNTKGQYFNIEFPKMD
jgi:hypothetical protein